MAACSGGGARGPVILPAFKAGDPALRGPGGGFDSHTLPPDLGAETCGYLRCELRRAARPDVFSGRNKADSEEG